MLAVLVLVLALLLLLLLFSLVALAFPKTDVDAFETGCPNGEGCAPNGEIFLGSANGGGQFDGLLVVAVANVALDEGVLFCPVLNMLLEVAAE